MHVAFKRPRNHRRVHTKCWLVSLHVCPPSTGYPVASTYYGSARRRRHILIVLLSCTHSLQAQRRHVAATSGTLTVKSVPFVRITTTPRLRYSSSTSTGK